LLVADAAVDGMVDPWSLNSVHGALSLTAYLDNPPANPDTEALFVYYSLKNMRDVLKEEWSGRGFPGYALGMSPVRIPVSAIAAAMSEGEKNALFKTAFLTKAEYDVQLSYGALSTVSLKQAEIVMAAAESGPPYALYYISSTIMN